MSKTPRCGVCGLGLGYNQSTGQWFCAKCDGESAAPDMVNSPPHYTTGKIEVIDFILDQRFGYLDGQVIKYVARYRHKGLPVQDLKKARFYLDRLIAQLEQEEPRAV